MLPKPISLIGSFLAMIVCSIVVAQAQDTLAESRGFSSDAANLEFFEKNVRPLLIQHCYECHSGPESKGGLKLDSQSSLRHGGDSGAVVQTGQPDSSLLVKAVRYKDLDLQMPPKNRLPESQIEILERWVEQGAVFPESSLNQDPMEGTDKQAEPGNSSNGNSSTDGSPKPNGMSIEDGRKFWSMLPLSDPKIPQVQNPKWVNHPIDSFVLHKLEANGLQPMPRADQVSLIRRATYDLIGLPPTSDEIDAFVSDSMPGAFERVVDRLLESPDYGVRWGRHWLDVARYADSNGLDENMAFGNAWRYRDYVVHAFNTDKPFDQFLTEQIAGDLLPYANNETRTATGFLVLGAKVLAEPDKDKLLMDTIDEQIDTVGKAFTGMTLGCARCHDHKFDPIKQADYYRLAAIFKSTRTFNGKNTGALKHWNEFILADAAEEAKIKEIDAEIAKRHAAAAAFKAAETERLRIAAQAKATEYLMACAQFSTMTSLQEIEEIARPNNLHPRILHQCRKHLAFHADDPFFAKWHELAGSVDAVGIQDFYRPLFEGSAKAWAEAKKLDNAVVKLEDEQLEAARLVLNDGAGLLAVPAKPSFAFDEPALKEYYRLADEARLLESFSPDLPAAMSVGEDKIAETLPIHIRGSHRNFGALVTRGFPEVMLVSTAQPIFPKQHSGRLELAQWLANSNHPLTARVYVNRVWGWHFGQALVRSTENFGRVGETPSHPELLDWLVRNWIESGFSTKQLHRWIMSSRTYQMAVDTSPRRLAATADPENRWLSHFPMMRLDAEQIRDSVLAVSGQLDRSLGGKTVPLRNLQFVFDHTSCDHTKYDSLRRSIYLPVVRNNLYSLFEQFDFPDPTMPTGHRNATTVAPQALLMMNSELVVQAADKLAQSVLQAKDTTVDRTAWVVRQVLGRLATLQDHQQIAQFLLEVPTSTSEQQVWTLICQNLLASNEFFYLR
jgi:hypothetical protein